MSDTGITDPNAVIYGGSLGAQKLDVEITGGDLLRGDVDLSTQFVGIPTADKYLNIDKVDGGWLLTEHPGMKRSVATSATGLADAVKKWAQGE